MWYILIVLVGVVTLVKFFTEVRKIRCGYMLFLGGAIWLRYFLSALHEFTFPTIIAGFSINALASIAVVGGGLFVVPRGYWRSQKLVPFYLLILSVFVSAVVSGQLTAFIGFVTKWFYLMVVAVVVYLSMRRHGADSVLRLLLMPLCLPVTLQVLSIVFGVVKATEGEGAASFIGGYNHEAAFSVVILTFMSFLALIKRGGLNWQIPLFSYSIPALIMVNYRTAILAAIPVILVFYWSRLIKLFVKSQRLYIILALAMLTALLALVIVPVFRERFSDIAVVVNSLSNLVKSDLYYTDYEQDIFSARLYIWSQYLTQFFESDLKVWIFGFGPDYWKFNFEKYAHNTFVSYLYEFGFLGLGSFCFILLNFVSVLLRSSGGYALLSAHLGFIILNMATMPLWQIEGVIFYGVLIGASWFHLHTCKPLYTEAARQHEHKVL